MYLLIMDLLKDKYAWSGTATELCDELKAIDGGFDCDPANARKRLTAAVDYFKKAKGIDVEFGRTHADKIITFTRIEETE